MACTKTRKPRCPARSVPDGQHSVLAEYFSPHSVIGWAVNREVCTVRSQANKAVGCRSRWTVTWLAKSRKPMCQPPLSQPPLHLSLCLPRRPGLRLPWVIRVAQWWCQHRYFKGPPCHSLCATRRRMSPRESVPASGPVPSFLTEKTRAQAHSLFTVQPVPHRNKVCLLALPG